ncbi:MAG: hypothetical protein LUC17_01530 [Oscillospiraceae bacterium]|nr:hypothetical protein [Oscillospiraceae bacterium]
MPQVKHYDKRVGITYVYDAVNYYDPEKKQSRSRRKLVGRLDPETGEVVPCGKPGRPRKNATETPNAETEAYYQTMYEDASRKLSAKDKQIARLEEKITSLQQKNQEYYKELEAHKRKFAAIANSCNDELK